MHHQLFLFMGAGALWGSSTVLASQFLNADAVLTQSYAAISSDAFLVRRQDDASDDDTTPPPLGLNADGSFNASTWSQATHAACQSTLSSLRRSPNPSGSSVCFNLPSLDANTGIFEADLRLYRVFPPSGPWEGVDPSEIDVSVGFPSAEVGAVREEDIMGMGLMGEVRGLERRQSQQPDRMPELMQAYLLVGQIKADRMQENLSMSDLEALLMPVLTLRAGDLQTTVSPNSASFVTGVFSNTTPQSSFSLAQRAVDEEVARLEAGEVAFVLPGTQILIFPIGLVITGTWLLLGLTAYGYGTYQRYQYRELYKARKTAMDNMGRARTGAGI